MKKTEKQEIIENSIKQLKSYLPEGAEVLTLCNRVSKSGMSRRIKVYTIKNNGLCNLTYLVSKVLGYSQNDEGLLVKGCGMNMGFHIVHSIEQNLFGVQSLNKLRHNWIG